MITVASIVALRILLLAAVVCICAILYNMVRMAEFIRPDATRGTQNFYAFWLENSEFVSERGPKFRNRYYASIAVFIFVLLLIAVAVSQTPEGSSPW